MKFKTKAFALMLSAATIFTSIFPAGQVMAGTEDAVEKQKKTEITAEGSIGSEVHVKLSAGGSVRLFSESTDKKVTSTDQGENTVSDHGQTAVSTPINKEGYNLSFREAVNGPLDVTFQALDGYHISTYRVTKDGGATEEKKFSDHPKQVKEKIELGKKVFVLEVSFEKDASTVEKQQEIQNKVSGNSENNKPVEDTSVQPKTFYKAKTNWTGQGSVVFKDSTTEKTFKAGDTVELFFSTAMGHTVKEIQVTGADGQKIASFGPADYPLTFTMPTQDVTVSGIFTDVTDAYFSQRSASLESQYPNLGMTGFAELGVKQASPFARIRRARSLMAVPSSINAWSEGQILYEAYHYGGGNWYAGHFGSMIDRHFKVAVDGHDDVRAYCLEPMIQGVDNSKSNPYRFNASNARISEVTDPTYIRVAYYGFDEAANVIGTHDAGAQALLAHVALAKVAHDNVAGFSNNIWNTSTSGTLARLAQQLIDRCATKGLPSGKEVRAYVVNPNGGKQALGFAVASDNKGKVSLHKSAELSELCSGNSHYNLAGAVYGIYADPELNNQVGTLTTNENGDTGSIEVTYGTYYAKELTAPKGFYKNDEVYQVNVNGGNQNARFEASDIPMNDPISVLLSKRDKETGKDSPLGGASLEGAEYTVKYYDTDMATDPAAIGINPVRTWVFKTDAKGRIRLNGLTNENISKVFVSGDDLYKDEFGNIIFPLGILTIQETKAPTGYLIDNQVFVAKTTESNSVVRTNNLPISDAINSAEQAKRGDLAITKTIAGTGREMPRVRFEIKSKTTGETHVVMTDENGYYSTSSDFIPHSFKTNQGENSHAGVWFGADTKVDDSKGALPFDTYIVTELPSKDNYGYDLVQTEITVSENAVTVSTGNLKNYHVDLQTQASYTKDGSKTVNPKDTKAQVTDVLAYTNLTPGREYTVKGIAMDQATQKPLLIGGKEVTVEAKFTPQGNTEKVSGTATVTFTFDATKIKEGTTIVIYQTLYWNDMEFQSHRNMNSLEQTVYIPSIHTTATNAATGKKTGSATAKSQIKDVVNYRGLTIGKEYTIKGKLMDKATGLVVTDAKGREVTAEKTFKAEAVNGSVELIYELDASLLGGKTTVVFENLYYNGNLYVAHNDLNDVDQTIPFGKIKTTAMGKDTGNKLSPIGKKVTIVDSVSYKNLIPGETYTMKGKLMDKATGKELLVNGKPLTAEKTFVAKESNGSVEITFTLDSSLLSGKTTVVFENIQQDGIDLAIHADIEDKDQTVFFPEVHTKAMDVNTKDQVASLGVTAISDVFYYGNLIPGETYTVKGTAIDQKTGKAILYQGKEVTAETTFTATNASGELHMNFNLDTSKYLGQTIVIVDDLYDAKGVLLAAHNDRNNVDQSIYVPQIHTTALDAASHSHKALAEKQTTIVDTITYTNLIVGKEYTVKGKLMDKATGKELLVNGKPVVAEKTFVAESVNGSVDITFTLDSSNLAGKSTVVFEQCFYDGKLVAAHENIHDAGQTVNFYAKPKAPKTSDSFDLILWGSLMALAAASAIVIVRRRRRDTKVNQ